MTKSEAARYLGVAIRTLEQYMHDGRISYCYVPGRSRSRADFSREQLDKLKLEIARPIFPNATRNIPKRRSRQELFEDLSAEIRTLRRDLCFAAEVILVQTGMPAFEARSWVEENLGGSTDVLDSPRDPEGLVGLLQGR